jgi:uncharacterized protein
MTCEWRADVAELTGRFTWYELMTTDMASARAFYAAVVDWGVEDRSLPHLSYTLFTSGQAPVSGLMDLPQEARRMGATPRWMGYVSVDNADVTTAALKRLGGTVYVPPTDSNIGRIAVVTDPQAATLALVQGLSVEGLPDGRSKGSRMKAVEPNRLGRVGWHELLTTDAGKAFVFYSGLFDWRKADGETDPSVTYQLFAAGEETIGGMFKIRPMDPVPFWLFYFNVSDIDAAAARVERAGGSVIEGPLEIPGGSWIVRCRDPQGAGFALQGKRSQVGIARAPAAEVGWSTAWGGISSRGRIVVNKPRGRKPAADSED